MRNAAPISYRVASKCVRAVTSLLVAVGVTASFGILDGCGDEETGDTPSILRFVDRTSTFLPDDSASGGRTLELGDLTDELAPDLVVGYERSVAVWSRRGSDRYREATNVQLPSQTMGADEIRLIDVNRDRSVDIVLGSELEGLHLWIQNGSRNFIDESDRRLSSAPPIGSVSALETLDLDGDRAIDLFVSGNAGTVLLQNQSNGFYRLAPGQRLPTELEQQTDTRDALFQDLDGDGDLDLLADVLGELQFMEGRGNASFVLTTGRLPPLNFGRPTRIIVLDVDRADGPDIVASGDQSTSSEGGHLIFLDQGDARYRDGNFLLPPTAARTADVQAADLDLDGDEDLVFATKDSQGLEIFLNEGDGRYQDKTGSLVPGAFDQVSRVRIADVDSDGDADILAVRPSARTLFLENQLDPGPTPTATPTATPEPTPTPTP